VIFIAYNVWRLGEGRLPLNFNMKNKMIETNDEPSNEAVPAFAKPMLPVPSYSISRKKKLELYGQVHEDIMQARITILTLLREKLTKDDLNKIDNAFFRLHMDCPKKAVDVFTRHGR